MSMYGMVMGDANTHNRGGIACAALNLTQDDIGRFRDAWFEVGPDGQVRVAIYTRNGGGNREDYQDQIDTMRANPYYLADADDDFDCTYATFWFRLPPATSPETLFREKWREIHAVIVQAARPEPRDMSAEWQAAIARIGGA